MRFFNCIYDLREVGPAPAYTNKWDRQLPSATADKPLASKVSCVMHQRLPGPVAARGMAPLESESGAAVFTGKTPATHKGVHAEGASDREMFLHDVSPEGLHVLILYFVRSVVFMCDACICRLRTWKLRARIRQNRQ